MPLVQLRCDACDVEWETVIGATVGFSDDGCASCGQTGTRMITSQSARVYTTFDEADFMGKEPAEREMIVKNKRLLESRSDEILDGRLGISENGPKFLRPQCPDHLRKRYY